MSDAHVMTKIALARILPACVPELEAILDIDQHRVHARLQWYRRQGLVQKSERAVMHSGRAYPLWEIAFVDPLAGGPA